MATRDENPQSISANFEIATVAPIRPPALSDTGDNDREEAPGNAPVIEDNPETEAPIDSIATKQPPALAENMVRAQAATDIVQKSAAIPATRPRDQKAAIAKALGLRKDLLRWICVVGALQLISLGTLALGLFYLYHSTLAQDEALLAQGRALATHNEMLLAQDQMLQISALKTQLVLDAEKTLKSEMRSVNNSIVYFQQLLSQQHDENNLSLKIMVLQAKVKPELAKSIARYVKHYATIFKLDADMVLAIMAHESVFDPDAVSPAGAVGLMQILPQWKPVLGIAGSLTNPETSIRFGMQIFGLYLKMYGDTELALTAYNRGPGPVDVNLLKGKDPRNGYAGKVMAIYERLTQLNYRPEPRVDIIALARAEANKAK